MFRTSDIILIAVMVSAAAMTYKVKRDAEVQQAQVVRLQAQIHAEEDTIDLLKADWSLLTQPSRLERLVNAYQSQLALQPLDPRQIAKLSDIPIRPVTIEDLTRDSAGTVAANGKDNIKTGAVR